MMRNTFGILTRVSNSWKTIPSLRFLTNRQINDKSVDVDADPGPIKYMQSPAAKWTAKQSRTGVEVERLWYEPLVLIGSIATMLIYFCVLREENDVDIELGKSLYSRFPEVEVVQLQTSISYNQQHGLPTKELEDRLKELQQ